MLSLWGVSDKLMVKLKKKKRVGAGDGVEMIGVARTWK